MRIRVFLALVLALLWGAPVLAQSSATPVIPGYLTSSGCPPNTTSCFKQFGAGGESDVTAFPAPATSTPASGTVTTGATFQSIIAASGARLGCFVQNPISATETLYVFFGTNGSATTANSVQLAPGGSVSCNAGQIVLQDNVSVTAATTAHAFTAFSQ